MNKHFYNGAFGLGAAAILWVAYGFAGGNVVALLMTLVIAAVYGYGALELHRFRQASDSLRLALQGLPEPLTNLPEWLAGLPPSLQNPVRMRIEGERMALPGPALTPYLLGLLVMLGMLGTFLGMVVTLNGAVFALEGTSDLEAIRSAFATPIKGLGLAFGTSVAGVASSAMLGLISAFSRRERMQAAQLLDTKIAGVLRVFSHAHQRQETYKALQVQSQALPAVVEQMQAMMAQMERMGQQINDRLISNQEGFHQEVRQVYTGLATSVEKSLRDSLQQSAHVAADSIKPIVEMAMTGIADASTHAHARMVTSTQQQVEGLANQFSATTTRVADTWAQALSRQESSSLALVEKLAQSLQAFNAGFEQNAAGLLKAVDDANQTLHTTQAAQDNERLAVWQKSLEAMASSLGREWQQTSASTLTQQQLICDTLSTTAQQIAEQSQAGARRSLEEVARLIAAAEELVRARIASESAWTHQHGAQMAQITEQLQDGLRALRDDEAARGSAAVGRLGELQSALTTHLSTLGTALEQPIARLIETASEAPRAAAEVIGKLRQEVSNSAARDNELLDERARILETLKGLLASINHASLEQRGVIDALVASSGQALQDANSQFADKVAAEAEKLADIAASVTGSAVEVSALGEAFGFAVKSFGDANEKLIANLQRIEAAMDKSMARSDDQLAYYVAQAREVIDLSIASQKGIVDALHQLPAKQNASVESAA